MNNNKIVAVAFFLVGLVAAVSTYKDVQFEGYVRETLKRDSAQERCQHETLKAIRDWVAYRSEHEIGPEETRAYFSQHPLPTCDLG